MSVGGRGPKPDIDEMCVAWHELRSPSRGREAAPRLRAFTPPSATCFLALSLSLRGSGLAQGLHPSPSATCLLSLSLSRYAAQGWLRAFTLRPPRRVFSLSLSLATRLRAGSGPSPRPPRRPHCLTAPACLFRQPPAAAIRVPANRSHPSPGEPQPSESRRTAAIRVPAKRGHPSPGEPQPSESPNQSSVPASRRRPRASPPPRVLRPRGPS